MTKEEFAAYLKSTLNSEQVNDLILKGIYGQSARYYFEKSTDYIMTGNYGDAIKAIDEALKLNDSEYQLRLLSRRANCSVNLKQFSNAEKDFEKALALIDPMDYTGTSHGIMLDYVELLHNRSQNKKAQSVIELSLKLPRMHEQSRQYDFLFQAFYLKARTLLKQGDVDQSEIYLNQAQEYLDRKNQLEQTYYDYTIEDHESFKNFTSLRHEIACERF